MWWSSVRVRLTLWNVLVLAMVLGGFGFALCLTVQASQSTAIDRDLAGRARRFTEGPRGPGGPPNPFDRGPGPGQGRGPEPALNGGPAPPEGPGGPDGPEPSPGGPEPSRLRLGPDGRPQPGPDVPQGVDRPFGDGPFFQFRPGQPSPGERRFGEGPFGGQMGRRPGDGPFGGPGQRRPVVDTTDPQRYFERPLLFDLNGKSPSPMWVDDRPWDQAAFRVAAGGLPKYSTVTVNGERVRVLTAPIRREGQLVGVVQLAHPLGEQQRLAESQVHTLLILLPVALLVAGLGGLFLTNRALRPVSNVTQAAAQIGAEDLSRRLEVSGKDEMAALASTFNGMISRLDDAFRQREDAYRKLATAYEEQRRFTGDASHELRTPLTRIKGSTSLALLGPHCAESYREALEVADQAADVMNRIVQDLLILARSDAGQLKLGLRPAFVAEVLRAAVLRLEGMAGATMRLESPPAGLLVMGNADHLTRVFVNLLENALRHTPNDGTVTLSARQEGAAAVITVSDTGEGIAPEHLPHVCERFYRADAARTRAAGGTGLGLAICQSIVEAHGGTIEIRSRLGLGTNVEVRIPIAEPTMPALEETPFRSAPALAGGFSPSPANVD